MSKIKTGDKFQTTNSGVVTVLEYYNATNILVEFDFDKTTRIVAAKELRAGFIKNGFVPHLYGRGYYGEQKTVTRKEYGCWVNMFHRCYGSNNPAYAGCEVHEDWYSLDKFLRFYRENYVEGYELDKDLLFIGNRVYSETTCSFVPPEINCILHNSRKLRGEYPVGVTLHKPKSGNIRYRARCQEGKSRTRKHIGLYNTPEEAFCAYKEFKENRIKQVANKFKDVLDERIYNNLMNYCVEITD